MKLCVFCELTMRRVLRSAGRKIQTSSALVS